MKLARRTNRILFFSGLSLPLLALLAIGWLVRATSGKLQESFFQVAQTYKVINLVEQTQLHLLDAETERRGYLLAGGGDYLNSYGNAMESIQKDIQQLQTLLGNNANEQTNILQLQNLITVRLGINPGKIAEGATNLPDLLALSLTTQGKQTMDEINRVLFQMREGEEDLLNSSQQHAEANAISSQMETVVLIGTVAVALLFIIFILLRLEKLQQFVTVCAWTGQVKHGNEWVRLDEYLKTRFGLSVSHGLSNEAAEKMRREIEEFNLVPNPPKQNPPPAKDA
jgi:CHASE3 domain sensor protein